MLGRVADGCYAPNRREVGEAEAGGTSCLRSASRFVAISNAYSPLASG
jgi:hypothetical protein